MENQNSFSGLKKKVTQKINYNPFHKYTVNKIWFNKDLSDTKNIKKSKNSTSNSIFNKNKYSTLSNTKPIHSYKKLISKFYSKLKKNLYKYNSTIKDINIRIIDDIIFDENKRIVSIFKDYLLWDEPSEFFKQYYDLSTSKSMLPKIACYYEKYTIFFPEYGPFEDLMKPLTKNMRKKKKYLEMLEEDDDEKKYLEFESISPQKNSDFRRLINDTEITVSNSCFLDSKMQKNIYDNKKDISKSTLHPESMEKESGFYENNNNFTSANENDKNVSKDLYSILEYFMDNNGKENKNKSKNNYIVFDGSKYKQHNKLNSNSEIHKKINIKENSEKKTNTITINSNRSPNLPKRKIINNKKKMTNQLKSHGNIIEIISKKSELQNNISLNSLINGKNFRNDNRINSFNFGKKVLDISNSIRQKSAETLFKARNTYNYIKKNSNKYNTIKICSKKTKPKLHNIKKNLDNNKKNKYQIGNILNLFPTIKENHSNLGLSGINRSSKSTPKNILNLKNEGQFLNNNYSHIMPKYNAKFNLKSSISSSSKKKEHQNKSKDTKQRNSVLNLRSNKRKNIRGQCLRVNINIYSDNVTKKINTRNYNSKEVGSNNYINDTNIISVNSNKNTIKKITPEIINLDIFNINQTSNKISSSSQSIVDNERSHQGNFFNSFRNENNSSSNCKKKNANKYSNGTFLLNKKNYKNKLVVLSLFTKKKNYSNIKDMKNNNKQNNQNNIIINTNINTISSTKEKQKSNSKGNISKRYIRIKKLDKKCSLNIQSNINNSNSISIEGTLYNKKPKKNLLKKTIETKNEITQNSVNNQLIRNSGKLYKFISNKINKKNIDNISSRVGSSSFQFKFFNDNIFTYSSEKLKVKNKIEKTKFKRNKILE